MLRSRSHNKLNKISDEVPNRIALKTNGEKSVRAPFTAVKFKPQMKLMPTSIKPIAENLGFAVASFTLHQGQTLKQSLPMS